MAGQTYVPIATNTLASPTGTVSFTSIPGTYTDLRLVVMAQNGSANFYMKPNSDSNNRYSTTYLQGDGTTAASGRFITTDLTSNGMLVARSTAFPTSGSTYGICTIDVMNYSNTTTYKTVLSRWGIASGVTGTSVNLYQNTAAITQLDCTAFGSNWTAGSTFTLYGIQAA